jgi:hypothetical protein
METAFAYNTDMHVVHMIKALMIRWDIALKDRIRTWLGQADSESRLSPDHFLEILPPA